MEKGLYFKLHDNLEEENEIFKFFQEESKKLGITKLQLFKICYQCYKRAGAYRITEVENNK